MWIITRLSAESKPYIRCLCSGVEQTERFTHCVHAGRASAERSHTTLLLIQLVRCWSLSAYINPHLFPPCLCSHWLPGITTPRAKQRRLPAGSPTFLFEDSFLPHPLPPPQSPKSRSAIRSLWSQPVFIIDSLRDKLSSPLCTPSPNLLLKVIFVSVGVLIGWHGINGFSDLSWICLHPWFPPLFTFCPSCTSHIWERGQLKFDFLCTLGQRTCVALSKDRESTPSMIPLPLLKKSWPRMMSALVQLVPPLLKK